MAATSSSEAVASSVSENILVEAREGATKVNPLTLLTIARAARQIVNFMTAKWVGKSVFEAKFLSGKHVDHLGAAF